ncbi:olfactory receptor 8U1-like [Ambystoma mexicanum]|uniref:olfactory receptor 8U1-like n=1 Tax=Ambystoma mexicanum TaxID=8296 RepID=UPI0037E7A7A5
MKEDNESLVVDFILLGLTDDKWIQIPLFVLFLLIYIITLVGNIGIITLIRISPNLQNPMYFLVSNLSFVDVCYSSNIMPTLLANFILGKTVISVPECVIQLFVFVCMAGLEVLVLVSMAYDRYIAICNPLRYTAIMTKKTSIYLVTVAYLIAVSNATLHTISTFQLSFCGSNVITHFYCDLLPLLKLSCSDTSLNELFVLLSSTSFLVVSLIIILISYAFIVSTILKIRSSDGRQKAFSTCSSHISCVTLFYGSFIFIYFKPSSSSASGHDSVASLFYTVVIPMFNPIIYSLRNQDVKNALRKWGDRCFSFK